jgi:Zn-dependent peptidase ImmA (M78 family)/transcriptional regulator with XRE-family HTH domain
MDSTTFPFNSEQLKLARLAAGLSFADVGSILGVTRQYASRLENDAIPSISQLQLLADALEVEVSFFNKTRSKVLETEQCHFRSVRSSTQKLKKMIMAQVELLNSHIFSVIDDFVDFPAINIYEAEDHEYNTVKDIEVLAEKVRRQLGLGLGPISHVIKLLESLGCAVINLADADEKIDAFSTFTGRPIVVRNTQKLSPGRLRFDFAHELGHLIMHQGIETGCRTTEQQANNFASAFLMPRSAFASEFPRVRSTYLNWDSLIQMKVRWGVSLKAIIYRAKALGLLSPEKAKSAYIYLSKNGYTKNERGDDLMLIEQPTMLQNAIDLLDIHTVNSIVEESGLNRNMFMTKFNLRLPSPSHLLAV